MAKCEVMYSLLVGMLVVLLQKKAIANQSKDNSSSILSSENSVIHEDANTDKPLNETCSIDHESNFCSPWVFCKVDRCMCGEIPNMLLQCSVHTNASILDNSCITYNPDSHVFELGRCFYNHRYRDKLNPVREVPHSVSDLNKFMCGDTLN